MTYDPAQDLRSRDEPRSLRWQINAGRKDRGVPRGPSEPSPHPHRPRTPAPLLEHFVAWAARPVRRWWRNGAALGLILLLAPAPSGASLPSHEYQVKASFLFNFVQFVQWPAASFKGPDSPVLIGVLGYDPFGPALEAAINGETARQRPIYVIRSHHWQNLQHCHLVFVSPSERQRIDEILQAFRSRPILTVSEVPRFAERGGVINFFYEGQKIRFEINPGAARRHEIKMSAQLLNLARIIGSPNGQKD